MMKNTKHQISDYLLLGNRGYLSKNILFDLF